MSLFRRRTPSHARPDNSAPSASALTGATQAFLKSQALNASLSNAAAAAALRSHTASPVPVSDIQTRRMLQRQNSNSSNGSAGVRPPSRGRGAPLLQRQNSSGSMTERTFRDPSPARPASRNAVENPPPVPRVPDAYNVQNFPPPPPPPKSHRRTASMEPLPRVMSPVTVPGGRGVSLDRKPGQPPGQPKGQNAKPQRITSLESVEEPERTDSRNSINFSYPNRARPNSTTPPASPISPISPLNNAPISNRKTRPVSTPAPPKPAQVMSLAETANVQYSVTEASNKPVKKKKKAVARDVAEGSHLSSGRAGGRPRGNAVDAPPAQIAATAAPARATREALAAATAQPPKKPKKKKSKPKVTEPTSQEYQPGHTRYPSYTSESDSASERESQTYSRPQPARASGQLQKQPSIVREDWEGEEKAALNNGTRSSAAERLTSPVDPALRPRKKRPATTNTSKTYAENTSQPSQSSQAAPTLITTIPSPELLLPSSLSNNHLSPNEDGQVQAGRPQSISPSRQAHFANYIKVEDANEPKHEPPPRSVSPAKSAMKHHSPSPQALSPVDLMPGSWSRGPPSEASESVASDEGSKAISKKKSVRVSFNEEAAVVGTDSNKPIHPPEPPVQETQSKEPAKRSWFSSNRGKAPQSSEEDVDDAIKPMPTLPSFGSIRQRKTTSDNSTPLSSESTSSSASSVSNQPIQDTSLSVSSDHVVGGILSQDFASKEKQQVNHVSNEPLPPEVTSVEGTGYGSDTDGTDGSIYSVERKSEESGRPSVSNDTHASEDHVTSYRELASPAPDSGDEAIPQQTSKVEDVPTISLHPATPLLEHGDKTDAMFDMPGGFPVSTDTLDKTPTIVETDTMESSDPRYDFAPPATTITPATTSVTEPTPASATPATTGIAEPTPPEAAANQDPSLPAVGAVAPTLSQALGIQTTEDEDEESDDTGNSIYSDAAEDASELEGNGFGSINAIVTSPMVSPTVLSPVLESSPSASGTTSSPPESPVARYIPTKGGPRGITDPASQGSWDAAQSHWSEIKKSRRESTEAAQQRATVPATQREPIELAVLKPKPKKKKNMTAPVNADKSLVSTQAARTAPLTVTSQAAIKSSTKQPAGPSTNMRRSMRSEPEPEEEATHMRQSMRSGGAMRGSMRGPPPQQQAPKKQSRHSMGSAPPAEPRGTLQKKNLRPVSETVNKNTLVNSRPPQQPAAPKPKKATPAAPKPAPSAGLRRTMSNDSDSSSSFKKARAAKPTGERYSMKRSMRSMSTPPVPSSPVQENYPSAKRDSTMSGRPTSASGGMRSTMRGSIDSNGPSLRNEPAAPRKQERPTSPSSFSFGRKPRDKAPKAAEAKSASRFRSRFGDSSDEEDGPKVFRSRYADSSDDEPDEPRKLRPVRGIPRKQDEGDSTDLEDSDDDAAAAVPPSPQPQPETSSPQNAAPTNQVGSALATGSLRTAESDADPKKKGMFSRFRSKPQKPGPPSRQVSGLPNTANIDGGTPASPASAKSPKLTRRNTPKRFNSESWPLPDKEVDLEKRPNTSDGVDGAAASASNGRVRAGTDSTNNTEKGDNALVGRAPTGKKKRFPMLRRAFRLRD